MPEELQALATYYPRQRGVLVLLLMAAVSLALGLTQPILQVEKFIFWESDYSVITGIIGLYEDGEYLLAFVIFFFSLVFPVAKLVLLLIVWRAKMSHTQRFKVLRGLSTLGKWSMLDVFAVAILVVAGKLGAVADVQPRVGVYLFAAGVVLSMLATGWIYRLALRAGRTGRAGVTDPLVGVVA